MSKKMKKRYIKPEMTLYAMEMTGVLAMSLPNKTRDNVEVGSPRFDDDEDEEWEDEEPSTRKSIHSRL